MRLKRSVVVLVGRVRVCMRNNLTIRQNMGMLEYKRIREKPAYRRQKNNC
ncbi:MAG: hypothetical protein Q8859_01175 [Bacteroidota bacterium]|nr:hypothetical protein [Bacteroidota bacterium]